MEIRLLKKDKNKLSFIVKGTNATFINAVRRNIINNVPTMAIEDVEFRKNSSILYDEIVAHRLGLIPLTTDLKTYNLTENCSCKGKGCAKCSLKLTLKVKGPAIAYASDIKSRDSKVKPVYPKTPIVKLLKGQSLEFEARAILGLGKDHNKWSPALAYYKYKPVIEIKPGTKNAEAIANSCSVDVFDVKNDKLSINKDNQFRCHLCKACVDIDSKHVKIKEDESEVVFYIESWGQLSPKEILMAAIKKFDDQLSELVKKIK